MTTKITMQAVKTMTIMLAYTLDFRITVPAIYLANKVLK